MKKASLKIVHNKLKSAPPTKEKEDKWNIMARRTPPKRYQHIFLGYFYSCNNFGHKAVHCKAYGKSYIHRNNKKYKRNKNNPRIEVTIHSLHYKCSMLNARSATIMVIKPMNAG
jgi:hypothetical protein